MHCLYCLFSLAKFIFFCIDIVKSIHVINVSFFLSLFVIYFWRHSVIFPDAWLENLNIVLHIICSILYKYCDMIFLACNSPHV